MWLSASEGDNRGGENGEGGRDEISPHLNIEHRAIVKMLHSSSSLLSVLPSNSDSASDRHFCERRPTPTCLLVETFTHQLRISGTSTAVSGTWNQDE